ncbi:sensor histidine kinase [Pyxidicoccus xibeiensis]|uniref:sensor histidine kinase n=1 Tax=Pyxidicoccus xibeiensis TaxID=2906759 RepID=UPI0020A82E8E|nr:ATP-binding protein [Pyxidicoccus xibeiensis]MCP3144717.1 HAMP domain-containing histidine kinase [Pyxidicoccus xibeiensis]
MKATDALEEWQSNDAVVRFASRLEQELRNNFARDASPNEIEELISIAIARILGLPDKLPSRIQTAELDRLAKRVRKEVFVQLRPWEATRVDGYATAIRATRIVNSAVLLTPVGHVFLELTGRDAIRWLLHVEATQSIGPTDPWRVSRDTAHALLQNPTWEIGYFEQQEGDFQHDWRTLFRLQAFGLLTISEDESTGSTHIHTFASGQSLLAEIEEEAESPMSILAGTLLSDLTLSVAESMTRAGSSDVSTARANATAEATARQARMVAHEIRNTLVPVKTSLSALYRELLLESPTEVLGRRRERIDRGIDAMFRFVEQLVELSKLAATPPEPFDLLTAIHDALASVEQDAGGCLDPVLPEALPPVSGHRARAVLALANVLRNATQFIPSAAPIVRIQAEVVDSARAVRVTVEDNGPGVPENMRQAIFDEGVSLRSGGSGLGLALVKEVFEKEMRGLVACDASPLGGARFTIRIPVTGVERP